jgi:hypothetical protein
MMRVRVVGAALLLLAVGAYGPAFGQQQDRRQADRKKNEQQAKGKEQPRSGQRGAPKAESPGQREHERGRPQAPPQGERAQPRPGAHVPPANQPAPPPPQGYARAPQRPYAHSFRTEDQARAWQQQRAWALHGAWQEHGTWEQHRARHWVLEHRTWTQRGGYGGFVVPFDRFTVLFGRQHWFRLYTRPVIVGGYPRFWFGGYWWMIVDPWPEFWSDTWYDADDVYIDYSDGYYLYNRRHPGPGLALTVVFQVP